ncbi:MAG TPA: phage holin family protein [Candidatus Acidoferrum sp.]|nr:phage holin family protein [Candidatus Acidoferrum sp.]
MDNGSTVRALVAELKQQAQTFFREEIRLVKAELTQKLAHYGVSAASMAVGGCLAFAGLIIFLGALGTLLGFAFSRAGLDALLAGFIGWGIIGLLVIGVGAGLLLKGLAAIKKQSPAPERTVRTLQQPRGTQPQPSPAPSKEAKDERTPEELEASITATEAQMADTLDELAERVSLSRARRRVNAEVRAHPYRWGLVAAGCGAAGSYLLKRRLSK